MSGISIDQIGFIFKGAGWTLVLSALGFIGGAVIGLPLALARSRGARWLRGVTGAYVQLIQGVPLPVIMFLAYFGEVVAGTRTGVVKRQYWVRRGTQWKIFFEGVLG